MESQSLWKGRENRPKNRTGLTARIAALWVSIALVVGFGIGFTVGSEKSAPSSEPTPSHHTLQGVDGSWCFDHGGRFALIDPTSGKGICFDPTP